MGHKVWLFSTAQLTNEPSSSVLTCARACVRVCVCFFPVSTVSTKVRQESILRFKTNSLCKNQLTMNQFENTFRKEINKKVRIADNSCWLAVDACVRDERRAYYNIFHCIVDTPSVIDWWKLNNEINSFRCGFFNSLRYWTCMGQKFRQ
jgi:hypothetical protein